MSRARDRQRRHVPHPAGDRLAPASPQQAGLKALNAGLADLAAKQAARATAIELAVGFQALIDAPRLNLTDEQRVRAFHEVHAYLTAWTSQHEIESPAELSERTRRALAASDLPDGEPGD